jgi:hypothetical protein
MTGQTATWGEDREWERQLRVLEDAQRGREARLIERLERLEATITAATERLDEELRAHLSWHQTLEATITAATERLDEELRAHLSWHPTHDATLTQPTDRLD